MRRFLLAAAISVTVIVATANTILAAPQPSTPPPPTAVPITPGTVIRAASCEQAPPQSVKDRATYTNAELQRYGLPVRQPGESFDYWAHIVRSAGKRFCDRQVTNLRTHIFNPSDQHSLVWAGNIADEPCCFNPDTYSEADTEFYVPCVTQGTSDAHASFWVGLGGWTNNNNNLVQTGIDAHRQYVANYGWFTTYEAWVENLAYSQNSGENNVFSVSCGDFMFVQSGGSGSNCNYIEDISTGANSSHCYGPGANETTAEAIAERPSFCDANGQNCTPTILANFGNVTFRGVGITDNGSYKGMNNVNHDYTNMWASGGYELATVGSIVYDGNQNPPDDYTVTWHRYS